MFMENDWKDTYSTVNSATFATFVGKGEFGRRVGKIGDQHFIFSPAIPFFSPSW